METKENIAPEASEQDAPKVDNPSATPAEPKEAIDPRIVSIVGEENIKSAYGEQPKEDKKPSEDKEEEKEEEKEPESPKGEEGDQEKQEEEKEDDLPKITPPEPKPTRLDRRLASLYIRNLHLMGEENIPTEEEVLAYLKKHSKEDKIEALHFHRLKGKELRGEKPTGDDFDDEDKAAIQDAEREAIREEILAEENEKQVKAHFIDFIEKHPELDESKKEFNPKLAQAVETLWRGGMNIQEAFETVTEQIEEVKKASAAAEEKEKSAALAGAVSGTGQVITETKELDWDEVARIEKENPALYKKMLAEGKFKHLM